MSCFRSLLLRDGGQPVVAQVGTGMSATDKAMSVPPSFLSKPGHAEHHTSAERVVTPVPGTGLFDLFIATKVARLKSAVWVTARAKFSTCSSLGSAALCWDMSHWCQISQQPK